MALSPVELEAAASTIGVYALMAISLNMLCGMTGMLQLGHAGFFAAGAYAAGLVSIYATFPVLGAFNLAIGAAAAIICAALLALALGFPCLRLRGDYLAIATLAFGEIVRITLSNCSFPGGAMFPGERIGGPTGIAFTEYPGDLWPAYPSYNANYAGCGLIWISVAASWLILLNIKNSSFGRAMACLRDDEIAAQSVGIDVPRHKIMAFIISAAFAGFAGALFFHKELRASPANFTLLDSIEVLLMVVVGGLGSFTGSILGAVFLGLTPFVLRHLQLGEYKQLIYATMLILIVRLIPDGILGSRECPSWISRLASKDEGGQA